ncbi:acox-1.1 [Pristionchus pacificus]|uniref:Acyl-coenzyme A oxidase n=1 Tax=Pristionchus pacificus TaxID=54126 RepID=A0A2A6BG34_PRIPA|nr:acox-1.1 [Pristionchus pacificus]|eukprot:PDM64842.1 hypothetical protein PRIPAC_53098 [Pristionchus pacificus]
MPNKCIQPGDNPDLTKERKTCTFDTDELTSNLYGSRYAMERRREITKKISTDPDFANPIPLEFLSREKRIEATAKKTKSLIQRGPELCDVTKPNEMYHLVNEAIGIDGYPLALHYVMFIPSLVGQADDDLAAEIIPRAMSLEIIGTYAQTEMGHGTNLRELETTATYDKKTQEFVINTPTRSAMKWWPGNLGKMSNYAVVCCQLYIDGKKIGPHNFLVQLRCEKSHKPLPGITVGDIGPKMSYNTTDNGFLAFDNVRIPRKHMLMKHSKVSPDGVYTSPMHAKLSYGTMVHVRAHMVYSHGHMLATAAIVATRYSAVRKQGRIEPGGPEVQILDYQTQQHRIFPQIARAYAILFTGLEIKDQYAATLKGIAKGETDLLPDLHAITSGLKSVVTHMVCPSFLSFLNSPLFQVGLGIEQCRMACGGHGYSVGSGLPQLYGVQIGGCTYEGENMVMLQQTARYLMKAVKLTGQGKTLSHSVAYITKKENGKSLIGLEGGDIYREIEIILSTLEHTARRLAFEASQLWENRIKGGETKEQAWNGVTVEMNRVSRVHTRLFMARCFHNRVLSSPSSIRPVLTDLLSLYLHYECVDMAQHLLEDGHCNGGQIQYLKKRMYEDLATLRPNAVSLVDSIEQSDRELNSVLGRRDGNVYEALYQWAKQSELNYTDVLPAVQQYMMPMMEQNRSKI